MLLRRGTARDAGRAALAVGLITLACAVLLTAAEASPAAGVLVRQDATLTTADRAGGMPTTSAQHRHIARATVKVETYGQGTAEPSYFIDGRVELAAPPISDPDAELNLGFGHRDGGTCVLAALRATETSDYRGTAYEFVGYNPDYFPTPSRPWDCVAVFLDDSFDGGPATVTYDAFVGSLTDTRESPRLALTRVDLLGKKTGHLRLVRGVPTEIGVSLRNSGKVSTGKLTIRANGKGIKPVSRRIDPLGSERSGSTSLKVRLTGRKKRTRLRIVVGDGSVRAARVIRVTRVRPPRRPVVGTYRNKAGSVKFSVRKGKVVGWLGTMVTRCGGFPDPFRYSTNTYSFRTVRIPKNGILQAVEKGSLYSASLRLRIVGRKVTRGLFTYYGPDRCFASTSFNASRRR